MRFLIITPARDEESTIGTTLSSMINQTCRPDHWVVVDDGSTDRTSAIAEVHAVQNQFITILRRPDRGFRSPGEGVVEAFEFGLDHALAQGWLFDVVGKLDADLDLPHHALACIRDAFAADPTLGIAGLRRLERRTPKGALAGVAPPEGFVGGPTKFYRWSCFEEIGGLIRRAGWDGVDNVRANLKGWRTREISSPTVVHLRSTGTHSGEGFARACRKYGLVSYHMGGHLWYFILRMTFRSLRARDIRVAWHMARGYAAALAADEPRQDTDFRRFLRRLQRRNAARLLGLTLSDPTEERVAGRTAPR